MWDLSCTGGGIEPGQVGGSSPGGGVLIGVGGRSEGVYVWSLKSCAPLLGELHHFWGKNWAKVVQLGMGRFNRESGTKVVQKVMQIFRS